MIILMEDKEDDVLSLLFRYSLAEEMTKNIRYSNGNGNLVRIAEKLLKDGETVLVLLDTVPANKSIRDIYISLRRLSREYNFRLVVWNIICAEYYFIKAFGDISNRLKAFKSKIDIEIIQSCLPYKNSSLITTDEDRIFTKTFEKFCKLFIMKNGSECVNEDKTFYFNDCICDDSCDKISIAEKSEIYRKSYELFDKIDFSEDFIWNTHHLLIDKCNEMIERYNDAGYLKINLYPVIK